MRYNKPAASLRKACIYSNENYALAGEFIAKLAGEPYDHFVKANILNPLGMADSTYDRTAALDSGERVEGFIHYGRDLEAGKQALDGKWDIAFVGEVGQTTFWNEGDGMFMAAYGGLWTTGNDVVSHTYSMGFVVRTNVSSSNF
jgi:CubicO group peptidase (beta-lactamase class C family)